MLFKPLCSLLCSLILWWFPSINLLGIRYDWLFILTICEMPKVCNEIVKGKGISIRSRLMGRDHFFLVAWSRKFHSYHKPRGLQRRRRLWMRKRKVQHEWPAHCERTTCWSNTQDLEHIPIRFPMQFAQLSKVRARKKKKSMIEYKNTIASKRAYRFSQSQKEACGKKSTCCFDSGHGNHDRPPYKHNCWDPNSWTEPLQL